MKTVKSFGDIPKTPEMAEQQLAISLFRWALAPEYRAVPTRSGQIVHKRHDGKTLSELEEKVNSFGPRMAARIREMPAFLACARYLCPDEHRQGQLVA